MPLFRRGWVHWTLYMVLIAMAGFTSIYSTMLVAQTAEPATDRKVVLLAFAGLVVLGYKGLLRLAVKSPVPDDPGGMLFRGVTAFMATILSLCTATVLLVV